MKLKTMGLAVVAVMLMVGLAVGSAMAKQTITDQLGRQVVVPDKAERIVVLMHQALDIMLQLGAEKQIVGVMERWKKYLPGAIKAMPRLKNIPTPGDLKTVNLESLLMLKPDLVVVTHYAPEAMRNQIEQAGIPVIGVSLYRADYVQASVLNPKLKDASKAYTEGLKDGVRLIGQVTGRREKAEELLRVVFKNRALVQQRLGTIPRKDRTTCYMAYPKMHSMGTGKYASVAMERAGGRNVAEMIAGYTKVNMEQVLQWNPEVIFIQDRYEFLVKEIGQSAAWQPVSAVKNHRIYLCPEYVKPWGHPLPESMALGELWMAKKLYPDKFRDVHLSSLADDFYRKFYGIPYEGRH